MARTFCKRSNWYKEYLRLKLIELEINIQKLPTEEDFLTTENMFNSQDVNFPVHMKSISTYKLNHNVTLTIGILSRQLNLPNGIISLEDAQENNLYEGVIDEWSKHFNIENIHFISVDMQIFVFIESTIFPYWRYRSFMDVSYPMEWRNGFKIQKPNERTSTIWPWSSIIWLTYWFGNLFGYDSNLINLSVNTQDLPKEYSMSHTVGLEIFIENF